jgi:NAD(P)H-nitrite reductase large subunit
MLNVANSLPSVPRFPWLQKQGYLCCCAKTGRHPRIAKELTSIFTEEETLAIVARCITYYMTQNCNEKRFADMMARANSILKEFERNETD